MRMNKPYVVSADIYLLMKGWAIQNDFVLPSREFFCRLRKEFSNYMSGIFSNFELVSEDEISYGLAKLVAESGLPAISLDRVYCKSELNLEIARLVDKNGKDCGLGHRAGTPPIVQQIKRLQMSGLREVVVVDDVVFSGALLERIVDLLSRIHIRVPLICAGVGIAEGINRINGTKREIRCACTYEEVIDEVCERDFYAGVPLSGRLLVGDDNIGVPYLLPFGKPESWASIPSEYATDFSRFCLHQTKTLFDEVERHSGRPVLCQDLGRKVVGLPMNETRYAEVLHKIL
ncbi:MAG: hypothetical protein A3G52_02200 [Candidatus Taylorbacteria bacterium RIFCSPLOWO2_12_FULL_43_20]|uniref:Phosphoribosyltransferase domain-containing protein n=1 Tax=Candidatus Taylorbacteria bacterium RIFCSPLOWO2_12_FULL_43_20 TaxID=1802332 RepID=A0A1G2P2Z0_9BACT|nr:MAG: hypothetical protein A2825_01085 [Candidatus Taylorbacteria bacterium RIFCSPHIGHO2_01_FULL_43_120]OHA28876.1 MAG: hypothetical protein A3E92_04345 [Candidatus Taylorbacteria bacterium RIFCSPHIGHO2_12_FULL_42_34]OHA30294.1 MAG: hypothetical protein A3B09_04000 [Candidatus Taylorbacteria bacterium RIFCSPLOWO2_01_FULL_43_83]OHA39346.1 MAG: hypothetical protein A3H58_04165 [Candidatus Taylorbacteria bacterium RIFCSPLOWO2_02_FULL_43_22b]OHA42706.1 MAG: hypothetical protein A3G52_02200 [Candi